MINPIHKIRARRRNILLTESMSCLIVRQPYASLIAFGRKRWEFRSRNARKRGTVVIASSRSRPVETGDEMLNKAAKSFPRGALLASARLVQSSLVTAYDVKKAAKVAVKTRIGSFEFWTADAPVGEPLMDLQALPSTWRCYAWQFDDVNPLTRPIPLAKMTYSSWTTISADYPLSVLQGATRLPSSDSRLSNFDCPISPIASKLYLPNAVEKLASLPRLK